MQTTANFQATNVFLEKDFLTRNLPLITVGKFIKHTALPARNSGTVEYSRVENLTPISGADLSTAKTYQEGITPSDISYTWTKIQVTTNLYAQLWRGGEQIDLTVDRPLLQEFQKVNVETKANLEELILMIGLCSGSASHLYNDSIGGIAGAARVNVAGLFNPDALDKAITLFEAGSTSPTGPVPTFTKAIVGSANYGSVPIAGGWVMLAHPHVVKDLRQMPGFTQVQYYEGQKYDGEVGTYNGKIRVVASTMCKIFPSAGATKSGTRSTDTNNSDVYASILLGEDAAASVSLDSATEIVFISHKQKDHANPLGLEDIIGFKMRTGIGVIDQSRILRIETVASA